MNEIYFFDLRPHPSYKELSGKKLDLKALMNIVREPDMTENPQLYLKAGDLNLPIFCITKSKDWEKNIRMLLILISGKTITDKALALYKELYRTIEKKYASQVVFDVKFVAFFVSLMIGFRINTFGWSEQSSNRVNDVLAFLDNVFHNKNKAISISSIFCAHRESDAQDMNTLVKKIKDVSVKRYIHLLQSLFLNINAKNVEVVWYHPIGGKHALTEVFPNIAIKHIRENHVDELLGQMNEHYKKVEETVELLKMPEVVIKLAPLDLFVIEVEKECQKIGGKLWRKIDNFNSVKNRDIRVITQEMTLKDISRYMPEYQSLTNIDLDNFSPVTNNEKDAVGWYFGDGRLGLHSKSFYETVFYYHWGKLTKKNNGIAIGIDRDHDLFQVEAFSLGYNGLVDISVSSPLLYARRSEEELQTSDINSTSIRQFWRLSENFKK